MNAITGMGGQLAVLAWLRHIGFRARMIAPSLTPDPGFDIVCFGENQLTVEVKTSSPSDGRPVEAFTRADRMPLSAGAKQFPNFYAWSVAPPFEERTGSISFDLLAIFPAGKVTPWAKPVTAPPGIRLADIGRMFSANWFAEHFRGALDSGIPELPTSINLIPSRAVGWGEENGLLIPNAPEHRPSAQMLLEADRMMDRLSRP